MRLRPLFLHPMENNHSGRVNAVRMTFPTIGVDEKHIDLICSVFLCSKDPRRADLFIYRFNEWVMAPFYFTDEIAGKITQSDTPTSGLHYLRLSWTDFDSFCDKWEPVKILENEDSVLCYGHYVRKDLYKTPVKPTGIKCTSERLAMGMQIYNARYTAIEYRHG